MSSESDLEQAELRRALAEAKQEELRATSMQMEAELRIVAACYQVIRFAVDCLRGGRSNEPGR